MCAENSLIGFSDGDDSPSYKEIQRCKHCLGQMHSEDALDEVCDECLSKEKLEWQCNNPECEHSWETVGISMKCPACGRFDIYSPRTKRLDAVRERMLETYLQSLLTTNELEKAILQFK